MVRALSSPFSIVERWRGSNEKPTEIGAFSTNRPALGPDWSFGYEALWTQKYLLGMSLRACWRTVCGRMPEPATRTDIIQNA
jgi:hypothetical protein